MAFSHNRLVYLNWRENYFRRALNPGQWSRIFATVVILHTARFST